MEQVSQAGKGKSTTLRKKTRLLLGMALIGLIGVIYAASSSILLSSLEKVEEQETRQLVKGVLGGFAQNQDDFNSRFVDWTTWDDTYNFIEDANKHYIESNLPPTQLALVKLNLVLYLHSSGRMVFGTGFENKEKNIRAAGVIPTPFCQRPLAPALSCKQQSGGNSVTS